MASTRCYLLSAGCDVLQHEDKTGEPRKAIRGTSGGPLRLPCHLRRRDGRGSQGRGGQAALLTGNLQGWVGTHSRPSGGPRL